MLYRCRACEYEEARGWLPRATCGLYFAFLLWLTGSVLLLAAWALKQLLPLPPVAAEPPAPLSWWAYPLLGAGGLAIGFALLCAVNWLLELTEYAIVRRKPCPRCGAKRWSWGFTRGFGL